MVGIAAASKKGGLWWFRAKKAGEMMGKWWGKWWENGRTAGGYGLTGKPAANLPSRPTLSFKPWPCCFWLTFSKRSHHWCATNEQNDFMLIFMWRFPKMGRPQVTMAFNTKVMVIHDLDDSGVSPWLRKPIFTSECQGTSSNCRAAARLSDAAAKMAWAAAAVLGLSQRAFVEWQCLQVIVVLDRKIETVPSFIWLDWWITSQTFGKCHVFFSRDCHNLRLYNWCNYTTLTTTSCLQDNIHKQIINMYKHTWSYISYMTLS